METPAIVIDMGTATTFGVVSKSGGYEGGVITPGAQGFLDFLHEKTALLPNLKLKNYEDFSNSLPRSTEHAMQFGARVGYSQMDFRNFEHFIKPDRNSFWRKA